MSFDSSLAADVYELRFEGLRVNFFEGSIQVINASILPREKPRREYPYINSSFRLTAERLSLEGVEIRTLLRENVLKVNRVALINPEVEVTLRGRRHLLLPFADTTATSAREPGDKKKRTIQAFGLDEFLLSNASFHTMNEAKKREFRVENLTISLRGLQLSQQPGEYLATSDQVSFSIGALDGILKEGAVQRLAFRDFAIGVDSLDLQFRLDTMIYRAHEARAEMKDLDIQTRDSLFHVAMKSFRASYRDGSVHLKNLVFKPNVSHAVLQRKFAYQHTEFSGAVGSLDILQVNFDSLLYGPKLLIDQIVVDSVRADIFKDKTKPMDSARRPVYLGQTVAAIGLPLYIRQVKATDVRLRNTERKPDSTYAEANITRASLSASNITNISVRNGLRMDADAYINDKARFTARLDFSYLKPQFEFSASVKPFELPDLNPLILAYTPAKINKGVCDEISFSGLALPTGARGTMKFLYHDLEIDLELHEQAKWKSAVIAFAANTVLNESNPVGADAPPRVVQFSVERDVTKGFVNVVIKSMLNGLKETMIMSKENRKAYQESKKKARGEAK
jgi:hypothetical protein